MLATVSSAVRKAASSRATYAFAPLRVGATFVLRTQRSSSLKILTNFERRRQGCVGAATLSIALARRDKLLRPHFYLTHRFVGDNRKDTLLCCSFPNATRAEIEFLKN